MALNFFFLFGTLGITLYDLAIIFGLSSYSYEPDLTFKVDTTSFKFITPKSVEFGVFLDIYSRKKDEINDADHVALLLNWLCHHVTCCRSKKVIKAYLGLVATLHYEMEVIVSLFVLSHIFKGINDLVALEDDEPSKAARGSIWMA